MSDPTKFLCIHGHFYQPPRENPWLEVVEQQRSAAPFHDWNERITHECYRPNAFARLLDEQGRVRAIINNYARMSFNFGPTLLAWMVREAPETYAAVLRADVESAARFSGHGSAMAQTYNHIILPLACARDQRTQVRWGSADFEHRFGRRPEGMWLAETAADTATLEALAEAGIAFTVLAPGQAAAVRPLDEKGTAWRPVEGGVDPSRAYRVNLPSGRSIAVFFYDGPVSQAVAFERLLDDGERFRARLYGAFDDGRDGAQLSHIATDGETYGHHHCHGEMGLAYALEAIEKDPHVRLTNYAEFLAAHPPTWEARVHDGSSWSCAHGVERWRSDCGCASGPADWNQGWRGPLRAALDHLRDRLADLFESEGRRWFDDPWAARDDYIDVVLDRGPERRRAFLARHGRAEVDDAPEPWMLLEMQRHAMLMYTSCGWFFDELSRIETRQVIAYAARAVQLAEALGHDVEASFLERLEHAKSNLPQHGDGRRIYDRWVRPRAVRLDEIATHAAVNDLFDGPPTDEARRVFCYTVSTDHRAQRSAGLQHLAAGRLSIRSDITGEEARFDCVAAQIGGHSVTVGVRPHLSLEALAEAVEMTTRAFDSGDLVGLVRIVGRLFADNLHGLEGLLGDTRRVVIERLLEQTLEEVESTYRDIHQRHAPLMRFLTSAEVPIPDALAAAAKHHVGAGLRRELAAERLDVERLRSLLHSAQVEGIDLDHALLGRSLTRALERLAAEFAESPADASAAARLLSALELADASPLTVDLAGVQERLWHLLERGEADADASLTNLAARVGVRPPG